MTINKLTYGAILFVAVICFTSCSVHRELRGKVYRSKGKQTYLIFKEKAWDDCVLFVDGKIWPYAVGERGTIAPGTHSITCGGDVVIEIQAGRTFEFDYWGP